MDYNEVSGLNSRTLQKKPSTINQQPNPKDIR
jgi:hypothetical protein